MKTTDNQVFTASYKTSSGAVKASAGLVAGIVITGGVDAASVTLSNHASNNSVPLVMVKAAINTTATAMLAAPVYFSAGIFATITGTTPSVTVIYV